MARMLQLWEFPRLGRGHGRTLLFELPNEPPCNGNEELAALNAFTQSAASRSPNLHGLRLIVLNLPEGNPHDNGTGDATVTRWKVQRLAGCVRAAVAGGHLVGLAWLLAARRRGADRALPRAALHRHAAVVARGGRGER